MPHRKWNFSTEVIIDNILKTIFCDLQGIAYVNFLHEITYICCSVVILVFGEDQGALQAIHSNLNVLLHRKMKEM